MNNGRLLLRVLRAAHEPRLTQARVAREASKLLPGDRAISASRYWQIEHGEGSEPDTDEKAAVAAALGVAVTDIEWPELLRAKAS